MIDIKELREQAGITQAVLAQRLGITQVQVSRYETNPDSVPMGLIQEYLSALGVDLATALARTQNLRPPPVSELGDPYRTLREQISTASTYLKGILAEVDIDTELRLLTESVFTQLSETNPKPRILLAGDFDSGKSHLANTLLGDRYLPSRYQPETRIPLYVRHVDDRPNFIQEDVWIMDKDFDPNRWRDADHAPSHKLMGGNFLTLDAWASHSGSKGTQPAGAALVFIDTPLLNACELLDTPGSAHDEHDNKLTEDVNAGAELVIYCSTAKGFLTGADILRIRWLAQRWTQNNSDDNLPIFERFFFVATHADPSLPDTTLSDILNSGAERLAKELVKINNTSKIDAEPAALRKRLFSFWSESEQRSGSLMNALRNTIITRYPTYVTTQFDHYISDFRQAANTLSSARIDTYNDIKLQLHNGNSPTIPWLTEVNHNYNDDLDEYISALKISSLEKITNLYEQHYDPNTIETFINREFSDRKSASTYAAARIIADLQQAVIEQLEDDTQTLLPYLIDHFSDDNVASSDWTNDTKTNRITIPPNARGLMLGGLAGIAGLGPIAAWASTLGPWGSYLVVVNGIKTLGITSTAAVSALTTIGGPGVLAAGLVLITTVLGGSFMGRTWQSRLAKAIAQHVKKSNLLQELQSDVEHYWINLKQILERDLERAEHSRELLSENLAIALKNKDPETKLDQLIRQLGDARTLIAHVPWQIANE